MRIGTCYFLGTIAALAEHKDRVYRLFSTDALSKAGVVPVRLYVVGKPYVVLVSDNLAY